MQCTRETLTAPVSDQLFSTKLYIRLSHLGDKLLLERLSYKIGNTDGQLMIDSAREMLDLMVLLWMQRDRYVDYQCDFDWMVGNQVHSPSRHQTHRNCALISQRDIFKILTDFVHF